jgi:hypothetical protein
VRVFPIVVRPCAWNHVDWLARLQLRPKDAEPLSAGTEHQIEVALTAIADEIAAIIARAAGGAGPGSHVPLGPDRIALAKLPSTHPDLFGRERELQALDAAWEDAARACLATARDMIAEMGYHRRDGEVAELEEALGEE